jgi:hypothetical protein
MEPQQFPQLAALSKQGLDMKAIAAQIVELVRRATPDVDGTTLEVHGWGILCILCPPPRTLENGSGQGRIALSEADALVAPQESLSSSLAAWACKDGRNMRTLKRFVLVGWAYRNGATSLRDVLRKLLPQRQTLGAENVPASTKDYSDCLKEVRGLFRDLFLVEGNKEVELFARRGSKPLFVDSDHQDTRPIIGLTEAGWQLWTETGRFLAIHGGVVPLDATCPEES